ncbi:MAG: DUF4255 domain-containing protein [Cyanobacteria bacterium J06648_16]
MSNHLAIATVTATLQRLLQGGIQQDVDGARVTTLKPNAIGSSTPESGVNLFLYQVTANTALKNGGSAAFRSKKGPVRRTTSLDLSYMLSVYGNDTELEPQRLLGSIVRVLSDRTVLTPDMIQGAIADAAFLDTSDLLDHTQQISIHPVALDTDELSKIWSTFFQAPYNLSVAYKVMAVVIDGEVSPQKALPIREPRFGGIMPFAQQPTIDKIVAQAGTRAPIDAMATLRILGKNLESPDTKVRMGTTEVVPQSVTSTEILISLQAIPRASLRAGIQSAQVLHSLVKRTPERPQPVAVTSNAFPFVLRPTVTAVKLLESEGIDDDPRTGLFQITTDLPIYPQQRAVVALNEWATESPRSYLFAAAPIQSIEGSLEFPFDGVKPGDYLIRLQIDGADSLLGVDTDPNSETYNWFNGPRVVIE